MEEPGEAQRRAIVDLETRLALLHRGPTTYCVSRELRQFYREAFALISEKVETQLANGTYA